MWGYHKYMGDVQYIGVFNINSKVFINLLPHMHHDVPWCTEYPPVYSWYPPQCTHGIPWCTHDIPQCTYVILRCTEHPPMYSWYPPDVLMASPQMYWTSSDVLPPMYSWYPPMYWTSPDELNTHYTGWEQKGQKAMLYYVSPYLSN